MDGDGWILTARIASVQRNVAEHVDSPASSQSQYKYKTSAHTFQNKGMHTDIIYQ